jgi:hypothetical protein
VAGSSEDSNEPSGFVRGGGLLDSILSFPLDVQTMNYSTI